MNADEIERKLLDAWTNGPPGVLADIYRELLGWPDQNAAWELHKRVATQVDKTNLCGGAPEEDILRVIAGVVKEKLGEDKCQNQTPTSSCTSQTEQPPTTQPTTKRPTDTCANLSSSIARNSRAFNRTR